MDNKVRFNNENFIVLKNISINKTEITFLINETYDKIIYLKLNYIGDRPSYVSLKSLIRVLPDYQNIASLNKQKILDCFLDVINKVLLSMKFINFETLMDAIDNFDNYIHKNEIYYYTDKKINIEIPDDIINKLTKHLNNYHNVMSEISTESNTFKKIFKKISLIFDKILYNKFCGAYAIMVIASAVGMMICFGEYSEWKESGTETVTIMDDILSTTEIDYGIDNEHLDEILSSQEDPNSQPITDAEAIEKYGSDYWSYKRVSMMSVDFTSLLNTNLDTVAWLYVNNTNINYPVVQTDNNEYYLNHSFDNSYNVAGWIFADYRADFNNFKRNNVIYGHGRVDQVMFGSLERVLDESWYTNEANQYIKLSTPNKNVVFKIVSVYTIPAESYYLTHNFESDDTFRAFLNTIIGRSIYNFDTDVNVNDKILTLSTCLDTNGNRIVVHAKLVREENR